MTIFFYILLSLCLVIMKTALIPTLPLFEKFYDPLIPIIIYLSLFRSMKEGIPIVLFFGLIMDSLCGGPVGLYLTTYIWLYAGMWWLSQFLHTGNFVLVALSVTVGVIFEGAVMLAYMVVLAPTAIIPEDMVRTVLTQIIWSMVTGPMILLIIVWAQKQVDLLRDHIFPDFLNMNGE
jgi:cell shape-determining protein MreD